MVKNIKLKCHKYFEHNRERRNNFECNKNELPETIIRKFLSIIDLTLLRSRHTKYKHKFDQSCKQQ